MSFDPFEDGGDEAQVETPPAPAKKAPAKKAAPAAAAPSEGKVVVTLKGGSGFEAPWIVIHADDVADAEAQVKSSVSLMETTQKAAKHFAGLGPARVANNAGGGERNANGRRSAPQGAKEAPAYAPEPPGSDWVYKSGTSARGPWEGWFPPYDQKDQHKPVFFKKP